MWVVPKNDQHGLCARHHVRYGRHYNGNLKSEAVWYESLVTPVLVSGEAADFPLFEAGSHARRLVAPSESLDQGTSQRSPSPTSPTRNPVKNDAHQQVSFSTRVLTPVQCHQFDNHDTSRRGRPSPSTVALHLVVARSPPKLRAYTSVSWLAAKHANFRTCRALE